MSKVQDPLTLFFEGDDYFESLWRDLEQARYSILIEVYILQADRIGEKLKKILLKKAGEGVRVKVLVDAIGSLALPNAYIRELKDHGVRVKRYHPLRLIWPSRLKLNKRDHRKLVVIDSRIGYLGGMNLNQAVSKKFCGGKRWQDIQVRLTGPAVNKMVYHFQKSFKEIRFRSHRMERLMLPNDILATENKFGRNQIRRFIHRYIRRSRSRIAITCAYFVPDIETIRRLVRAHKKRGVRVQILTNGPAHSDVPLVNRINRPILKYLIKRGIEVYFYRDRMLHTKCLVFDKAVATVGSTNINYRSFFRDREINLFIHQKKYARALAGRFEADLKNSQRVTLRELKEISVLDKILDWFFYFFRNFF